MENAQIAIDRQAVEVISLLEIATLAIGKKRKNLTSKRQLVSGGAEKIDLLSLSKKQDLLIFLIWNFYGKFHGILLYW